MVYLTMSAFNQGNTSVPNRSLIWKTFVPDAIYKVFKRGVKPPTQEENMSHDNISVSTIKHFLSSEHSWFLLLFFYIWRWLPGLNNRCKALHLVQMSSKSEPVSSLCRSTQIRGDLFTRDCGVLSFTTIYVSRHLTIPRLQVPEGTAALCQAWAKNVYCISSQILQWWFRIKKINLVCSGCVFTSNFIPRYLESLIKCTFSKSNCPFFIFYFYFYI